jgi:ATP diphosphatase
MLAWRRSKARSILRTSWRPLLPSWSAGHPHVFADAEGKTAKAVEGLWERIKAEEKSARGDKAPSGALAGVPLALPALTRALKLQNKAGRVGFDWNDPRAVLAKIREEADEIEAELDRNDESRAAGEVGDLLFAVVNLARHLDADPEGVLRGANLKFERRFAAIEQALALRGKTPQEASLAEMDELWDERRRLRRPPSVVIEMHACVRGSR